MSGPGPASLKSIQRGSISVMTECGAPSLWRGVAAGVTVLFAITGLVSLVVHSMTPGACRPTPVAWPDDSALTRDQTRPMLLLFLHPFCPCSRATLTELERILARNPDRTRTEIVFVRPKGAPQGWESSPLQQRAEAIPGVVVTLDRDGREAARFGAETSGHACLYTADGRLAFSGGLTAARGHEGESIGRESIEALIRGQTVATSRADVFGCPLRTPDSSTICRKEAPCSRPSR
jgi:hypothetical protein